MNGVPSYAALAVFCIAAMIADTRTKKVPNALNAVGFSAGIMIGFLEGGTASLINSLFGALLGFVILLVPFLLKIVGAGDVKFLAAAGAITGWRILAISFLAGAALGAIPGIITILFRFAKNRNEFYRLSTLTTTASFKAPPGSPGKGWNGGLRLPYTVPLSLGLMICSGLLLFS